MINNTIKADKKVEEREPLHTVDGDVSAATMKISPELMQSLKVEFLYDPALPDLSEQL